MTVIDKLKNRNLWTLNALELERMLMASLDNTTDTEKLIKAIDIATVLHSKQTRKSRNQSTKTPYIEHPLRCALRLSQWGVNDTNILIAALLHDTIEDQSKEYVRLWLNHKESNEAVARQQLANYLQNVFSDDVIDTVLAVTNPITDDFNYQDHVTKLIAGNPKALLVKLSDFVDNACGLIHSMSDDFIMKQIPKYTPLIPVFKDEIEKQKKSGILKIRPIAYSDIKHKLDDTQKNYDQFMIDYNQKHHIVSKDIFKDATPIFEFDALVRYGVTDIVEEDMLGDLFTWHESDNAYLIGYDGQRMQLLAQDLDEDDNLEALHTAIQMYQNSDLDLYVLLDNDIDEPILESIIQGDPDGYPFDWYHIQY